jgi:competence ComEA-like helix-hairpin-helix protein
MAAEQEKRELDHRVKVLECDKLLDRLVEKQIELDLLKRGLPVVVEEAPVEEPSVVVEEAPELIDINRCTERELMKLGFAFSVTRNITAARPFLSIDDLRVVPGVTRVAYGIVEKKITVGDTSEYLPKKNAPVVLDPLEEPAPLTRRVNINTCDYKELVEVAGASKDKAWAITGYRKEHGPYGCVDDIINARNMTQRWIDRHRDKLEV